jgi:hypothetical protein
MEAREEAREIDWRLLVGDEWAEWYAMTPAQRLEASSKLWQTYLQLGGSLDPEPDSQSPFYSEEERRAFAPHGRSGLRVVRRGGV